MLASPATTAAMVVCVVVCTLTVSETPHHLMVLVAQHPGQEKWGFVSASSFKASPRPAFAINRNIPLAFGTGSPLGAATPWRQGLLCGMVAGCICVVTQLMDPLHKLTLSIEHFLGWWEEEKQWATFVVQDSGCFWLTGRPLIFHSALLSQHRLSLLSDTKSARK